MANPNRPTNNPIHGNVYHLKLIMMSMIRGINAGYSKFKLGNELEEEGGKFDDLIFEYEDKDQTIKRRYIQAKHKIDGQGTIKFDEFICDGKGNFSLPKYFRSYCEKIKPKQSLDNIGDLVICTNYKVDELKSHLDELKGDDSILGFKDEKGNPLTTRYKIKEDSLLKEMLKGPIYLLAKKLFDCAISGAQMDETDVIFKDYHVTLIHEKVIDKTTTKFHQEFAKETPTALKADAQRLREVIVNISKSIRISDLWEKDLNLGKNFGILVSGGIKKIPEYPKINNQIIAINDIDVFLSKFVLAVTPHESNLDAIIKNELCDYSNHKLLNQDFQLGYFLVEMLNKFKKNRTTLDDSWMTSDEGKQILKKIADNIECFYIRGISLKSRKELLDNLKFRKAEIEKMKKILEKLFRQSNGRKYYEIQSSSSVLISANKVISALNTMDKYKADDSFLVVSANDLQNDNQRWEKVFLEANGFHHLLVVICRTEMPNQAIHWPTLMQMPNEKKILFITGKSNIGPHGHASEDDPITYDQLSKKTKKELLSRKILFQGVEMSLRDLIVGSNGGNEEVVQKRVLDSNCLVELLSDTTEIGEIPSFLQTYRFKKSQYIKRKIRRWICPTADQSIWGEVAKKLKCTVEQLKRECQRDETSGRINWNNVENDERRISDIFKAIYEINSGSDSNFQEVDEDRLVKELNYITDRHLKVIVISGVAGTGKSTFLSNIYGEIKSRNPNQWVIRIDLINHCDVIKEFNPQLKIVDLLTNNWRDLILGKSQFARSFLTERLKHAGHITFLFDGFDEIGEELQNNTIEWMKALRQTKADAIYLATRSHMNEKLENEFFQFANRLQNFTTEDQIKFFANYWMESAKVKGTNSDSIKKSAQSLVEKISTSLNEKESEFVGIPLQCRILAEYFEFNALQHNKTIESLIGELKDDIDLAGLYEMLMETKRQIYCNEKIQKNTTVHSLVETAVHDGVEFLQKFAINVIVESKKDARILLGHSEKSSFQPNSKKQREEKRNEQFGIDYGLLQTNEQGKLEFLHRTYAEYLVADFIYQGFYLDDNEHNQLLNSKAVRNLLVKKIFKNDLYEGVMRFFNCMLKSFVECDNWRRIIEKNDEGKDDLPKRWKLMVELIYNVEKDEGDFSKTTLLYLAMKRNFASFFIFLCDCLVHFFYPHLKLLTLAFGGKFEKCIDLSFHYENKEKTSSAIVQKLLSIYEASPGDKFRFYIYNKMTTNMENSLYSRNYKYLSSFWNNEEKRKTIRFTLEFLTKHKFIPENPIDGNYPIVKFFFRNGYYDKIITSLVEYLLVFKYDRIIAILQLAFRRYSCRRHWKKGKNEFTLKKIVRFLKTKGRSDLIKGLHREILVLGDEETKREILLSTDAATSFYRAAACGYENDCREILEQRGNYSDCKEFTLEALGDAILFKNIEMFRLILEAIKQVFSLNDLEDLLQSDMAKFVEYYKYKRKRRKNVTVFVVIDDEEVFNKMIGIFVGNRESLEQRDRLNKLFLQNTSTLNKMSLLNEKHRRFLFPTDKFEDWLKPVMNVNVVIGFRMLVRNPHQYNPLEFLQLVENIFFETKPFHRRNYLIELFLKFFLENEESLDKIALFHDERKEFLVPINQFEEWLKRVMDFDVKVGFRLITKHLHVLDRNQHEQFIRIITEKKHDNSPSYWNRWFELKRSSTSIKKKKIYHLSKINKSKRFEILGKLFKSISDSLEVNTLINDLLLHDDGYAIACELHTNRHVVERAFDSVPNLKDEFAKKWMQHLPGVLVRVSSSLNDFDSLDFILPMMKYASNDELSKLVNVLLEKKIWFRYITDRTDRLEILDQFLKLVSMKLGDSELEKLVFHRSDRTLARNAMHLKYHKLVDMLLSHLKSDHREKIGQELIKLPRDFDRNFAFEYMEIFPILVKHSDEKHLKEFVDNIMKSNTFKQKQRWEDERMVEYESNIWAEYLCSRYNLYIEPDADLVASILKWTSENLENDYIEKLIFHDSLITRVLLFRKENIVNAVLKHLPIEFYRKIAKHFMKNALEEFQDPKHEESRYTNEINTLFLPFLKKHAESQELVKFFNDTITQESNNNKKKSIWIKFFNDTITQERNNNKKKSIWIEYLRKCVKEREVDKVEEFWSFLSQNLEAKRVCDWMCALTDELDTLALKGNDDKFVKLIINEFQSNDYKKFWHDLIEYQLNKNIGKRNWFYLLPLFQLNADTNQLGKLIEIITHRCDPGEPHYGYNDYIAHQADQKTDMKKWSTWSYYIYYDVRCTSITIDKLLDCVRATKELGSSKVKELVLHKPNERDDPVVVRAAFNGETDVVEAMLRYLSIEDRKEVEQQTKAALNLEK